MKDNRATFLAQLDKLWPGMAKAFRVAINNIASNVSLTALERAIAARDIEAAFNALNMDRGLLSPLAQSITGSYIGGGQAVATSAMVITRRKPIGARIVAGFDIGNPRAAEWARAAGSNLITEITSDTRNMVAQAIREGLDAGRGPRTTALDIAGRIQGGKRAGGLVGLHSADAGYVQNLRRELADPDLMANYFSRTRRDKRFDAAIRRAISEGRPVAQANIERIAGRYADRLLVTRGERIARTETLRAMHAGRQEMTEQLIESGQVQAQDVTRAWQDTGDGRTRNTHKDADGQSVGVSGSFQVGGYSMRYPGDTSLGAPARETINCRCYVKISLLGK